MPSRPSDGSVVLGWVRKRGVDRLSIAGLALDGGKPPRGLAVLPADLVQHALKTPALQPLGGRFTASGDHVAFTPRLPFVAGLTYAVMLRGEGEPQVWKIERPRAAAGAPAEVVAIHPTAPEVPLNLLKIYVQFSAPMREGDAAEAVEVRRLDTGELLEDVFFQGRYELWDPERRRLTLLLDPGRIKRGLGPHEAMGYPLVEGTTVEVRVTDRFRDAEGRPLAAPASRRYRVAAPIREHVDPVRWRQLWPAAGASDPLEVRFDRPLDHAMLQHAVRVTDADGAPLPGRVEVAPEETVWRFHPENPWGAGPYSLVVEPMLEDLAGNSPIRVFDRDLERPEDAPPRPAAPIVMSRALAPAAGKVA